MNKIYLGDGLYGEFDGYQIELYASNGVAKTNQVFLEPSVLGNFILWIESLKKKPEENLADE